MKLIEAKTRVIAMLGRDMSASGVVVPIDAHSPDPKDPAKFILAGKPARVVLRFSGWHVPISASWFAGLADLPRIQTTPFYWYVFYVPAYGRFSREHYFICDYQQMRQWVLEFTLAHPGAHQDHTDWMAAFCRLSGVGEAQAYFRWGDEPLDSLPYTSRVVGLDNVAVLAERVERIGSYGRGGESEAHRLLKHYIAERPHLLGLSPQAQPTVEHRFLTGDRVDVLFGNHAPRRAVVEIEVEGEENLKVGIHQAIKYRSLAAAADGMALLDPAVRAYVVAYETRYASVQAMANAYDVRLVGVDRQDVLQRVA